jgi:hypothetical protein
MKNLCLFFIAVTLALHTQAQRPEADKFSTSEGELTIQPVLHGTLMIQFKVAFMISICNVMQVLSFKIELFF